MNEHAVQTTCNELLERLGWCVTRINSGKAPVIAANGQKYYIQLADPGTPDTMCYKQRPRGMAVVWIEYKYGKNKSTPLQLQRQTYLRGFGAHVWEIRSLEELQEKLKGIDQ